MSSDPTPPGPDRRPQGGGGPPFNVPKVLGFLRLIRGMWLGILVILFAVVTSAAIVAGSHGIKGPAIILASFGGLGVAICIMQFIGMRQLARYKEPSFTHLHTSTATEYWVPFQLQGAVLADDEVVGSWFGPVSTQGKAGIGMQVLEREVDHQAINTLLFTNEQVIGLMLAPVDLQHLDGAGVVKRAANTLVGLAGETAYQKAAQFEPLNANHWGEMVAALSANPRAALQDHLNYGLPYSMVASVEVKSQLVNPGFVFHLQDGRRLRYSSFKRTRLPEIASYLRQFVAVR